MKDYFLDFRINKDILRAVSHSVCSLPVQQQESVTLYGNFHAKTLWKFISRSVSYPSVGFYPCLWVSPSLCCTYCHRTSLRWETEAERGRGYARDEGTQCILNQTHEVGKQLGASSLPSKLGCSDQAAHALWSQGTWPNSSKASPGIPEGWTKQGELCLSKGTEEMSFSVDFSDTGWGGCICTQIPFSSLSFNSFGSCPAENFSQFVHSFSGMFSVFEESILSIYLCPGFYFTSFLLLFICCFPSNVAGTG